jgi:hypothetical protein
MPYTIPMTPQPDAQNPPTPTPETVQTLTNMIMGFRVSQMIHVAAQLDIAGLLNSNGPQTPEQLAAATNTHAPSLYRLLRALASLNIFAEDPDGRFTLTPFAQLLRSGVPGSQRTRAIFYADQQPWTTWGDLLYSITTGETAFQHIYNTDPWEYRSHHPELNARFNAYMSDATAIFTAAIVAAYDYASFGTLADIGGGTGILLSAILKANPQLHGILSDAPHVVSAALPLLQVQGVADRCDLIPCDFFDSVPSCADAYLLKSIIHDWDDPHSTTILKTCRRAIPPHGKLLLVENVILPGNDPNPAKILDLEMLIQLGGRERTEADFRDLLSNSGFRLTRILPTQSQFSIIEAVPA